MLLLKLDPGAKRQLQQLSHGVGIKLRIIHPRNHPIHGYRGLPNVNVSYRFSLDIPLRYPGKVNIYH